ncbi:uncharacterized protein B0T23DRAFT_228918 [Neurospora hispaniola]|uniref:Uncharacterized protein n=1 Tax=Neurospora hispaniola TaxID=588809 RepID=A0AAJ0MMQ5_9PEZI|nr:hypothetical protein B0T23DRAFT_228918 [Neurospora hispaniola]
MASRIPAAWRIRAAKSTNTGGLNFNHVNKSTLALARWTPTSSSALASSRSTTTTSTPAIAAWPPRLRLGSSGTVPPARSLFQRQQHQQRRSFGGFNFLIILMCYPPPPGLCCISWTVKHCSSIEVASPLRSPPFNTCCWLILLHERKKRNKKC